MMSAAEKRREKRALGEWSGRGCAWCERGSEWGSDGLIIVWGRGWYDGVTLLAGAWLARPVDCQASCGFCRPNEANTCTLSYVDVRRVLLEDALWWAPRMRERTVTGPWRQRGRRDVASRRRHVGPWSRCHDNPSLASARCGGHVRRLRPWSPYILHPPPDPNSKPPGCIAPSHVAPPPPLLTCRARPRRALPTQRVRAGADVCATRRTRAKLRPN